MGLALSLNKVPVTIANDPFRDWVIKAGPSVAAKDCAIALAWSDVGRLDTTSQIMFGLGVDKAACCPTVVRTVALAMALASGAALAAPPIKPYRIETQQLSIVTLRTKTSPIPLLELTLVEDYVSATRCCSRYALLNNFAFTHPF